MYVFEIETDEKTIRVLARNKKEAVEIANDNGFTQLVWADDSPLIESIYPHRVSANETVYSSEETRSKSCIYPDLVKAVENGVKPTTKEILNRKKDDPEYRDELRQEYREPRNKKRGSSRFDRDSDFL